MIYANAAKPAVAERRFRVDAVRPLKLLAECPAHKPTPLRESAELAQALPIERLWIKDESARMGLGSFKALGGAYAVAQMIADTVGTTDLAGDAAKAAAASMTFITASAGNHGLSVAAGARVFGAVAVIVLGPDVPESFADRIRAMGARVVRAGRDYEESVAAAMDLARENDWLLLADGSWEGYVDRPALVMEGYSVLAEECRQSFESQNLWPTHVMLQAGVGGLAASVAGHIRDTWAEQPTIVVVEPDRAPCLLESVRAGTMTRGEGAVSNMGRLDCKDASLLAFESLRRDADVFVSVSDEAATDAAARLAASGLPTSPSGGAGLAGLELIERAPTDRCLLILSEGPIA
jgi:diaminopropionate ammonia-lyase